MGLRWKTITASQLAAAFQEATAEGKADAYATLATETGIIKDISVSQAPVDTGELEAAHKVTKRANGSDKVTYDVTVGGTVNGVDVDKYAMRLHESSYNLGPKSLIKQAGTAVTVGPKFLERAFDGRIETTITNIYAALTKRFTNAG